MYDLVPLVINCANHGYFVGSDWIGHDSRLSQPRIVVILVDIALWFILVNLSPAYYLALFGLFIHGFRHLPVCYATGAALVLIILMIVEQVPSTGFHGYCHLFGGCGTSIAR